MVLALQLDDVYRKSILGVCQKKVLAGQRIARVSPTLVPTCCSVLPGFATFAKGVYTPIPLIPDYVGDVFRDPGFKKNSLAMIFFIPSGIHGGRLFMF